METLTILFVSSITKTLLRAIIFPNFEHHASIQIEDGVEKLEVDDSREHRLVPFPCWNVKPTQADAQVL